MPLADFSERTHAKRITHHVYNIYIDGGIAYGNELGNTGQLLNDLRQLVVKTSPIDEVNVHINSPGGSTYTMSEIIYQLKQLRARVNIVITGTAMSAGITIPIALLPKLNKITITEEANIMIHSVWTIIGGKPGEISAESKSFTSYNKIIMKGFKKLLPKKLYKKVIKQDKDVYISGKKLAKFINRLKESDPETYKLKVEVIDFINKPKKD